MEITKRQLEYNWMQLTRYLSEGLIGDSDVAVPGENNIRALFDFASQMEDRKQFGEKDVTEYQRLIDEAAAKLEFYGEYGYNTRVRMLPSWGTGNSNLDSLANALSGSSNRAEMATQSAKAGIELVVKSQIFVDFLRTDFSKGYDERSATLKDTIPKIIDKVRGEYGDSTASTSEGEITKTLQRFDRSELNLLPLVSEHYLTSSGIIRFSYTINGIELGETSVWPNGGMTPFSTFRINGISYAGIGFQLSARLPYNVRLFNKNYKLRDLAEVK